MAHQHLQATQQNRDGSLNVREVLYLYPSQLSCSYAIFQRTFLMATPWPFNTSHYGTLCRRYMASYAFSTLLLTMPQHGGRDIQLSIKCRQVIYRIQVEKILQVFQCMWQDLPKVRQFLVY